MGARGPKPKSESNVATVRLVQRERLKPAKHLTPIARAMWITIVETKAATAFQPSDIPLLEAYCVTYAIQRNAEAKINRALRRGESPDEAIERTIHRCSGRLASLSTKLRLAPNARVAIDASEARPTPADSNPAKLGSSRAGLMFSG